MIFQGFVVVAVVVVKRVRIDMAMIQWTLAMNYSLIATQNSINPSINLDGLL